MCRVCSTTIMSAGAKLHVVSPISAYLVHVPCLYWTCCGCFLS
jgi:hypothetical protein